MLAAALGLAACGGGGDGGAAIGGSAPAQIFAQPSPVSVVVVGQWATFHVDASGSGVTYAWQEQAPGGAWVASTGIVSQQPDGGGNSLLVGPVDIAGDETRFRSVVSTPGAAVSSNEARLDVVWGLVSTLDSSLGLGPGAGGFGSADGGSPGGGDGEGAGVGGGLGKVTQARIEVRRVADGALLGEALSGASTGLVNLKAGPGAGPLLITMTGGDAARYYDEGKDAMLALAGTQAPLHALVNDIDRHLGVTALSEAAYRYAINQFVLDPDAVRAGTVALARTATAEQLARLTPAQIQLSHEAVRNAVNGLLPARHHIESVATLPTPVDDTSGRGSITTNIYGTMQAVTGGLAFAAGGFNPSLATPALAVAQQLADDLTDGEIDGVALDGSSVFPGPGGAAYDPFDLAGPWAGAADALMSTLGDDVAPSAPVITAQPLPATIVGDNLATLTVAASGSALSYQWLTDEGQGLVPIDGATGPSLSTGSAADYAVRVTNAGGTVTSSRVTVSSASAAQAPVITTQPSSRAVVAGESASFTVVATGTDLLFQWRNAAGPIAGATTPTFTTGTAGTYTVDVSNELGAVTSASATLTITPRVAAPAITRQPASQTAQASQPATLTVGASGHGLAFQWASEQGPIAGAIGSSFITSRAGSYRVTVTNAAGSVTSNVAVISAPPPASTPPPQTPPPTTPPVDAPPVDPPPTAPPPPATPPDGPLDPIAYRSFADSPFRALRFAWFHLENWSDHATNTPGVSANTSTLSSSFGASLVDSVDGDDGSVDGTCAAASGRCDGLWGSGSIVITFDASALGGRLPNAAGLAVTDVGAATVTVEAFDASGATVGRRSASYPSGVSADVTDDRFFGFAATQGIARIAVRADGGLEIDHLQYGFIDPQGALPSP